MSSTQGGRAIGIVIRNFRGEDLGEFTKLYNGSHGLDAAGGALPPQCMGEWLALPRCQPEVNLFLAVAGAYLAGYAQVTPEPEIGRAVVEGAVHPNYRRSGIGSKLLRAALSRSRELETPIVHICAREMDTAAGNLLRSAGFYTVRRYWQMRWQGGELLEPEIPRQVSLRSFQEGDEERLTQVQNAAFGENWGFCPNTVEETARRVRLRCCRPEGILLAEQDGQTVAYCWTRLDGRPGAYTGAIWMSGVHPHFWGTGLGRLVLLAGMAYLKGVGVEAIELTVDEENAPARKLYLSVGFRDLYSLLWYERALRQ